MNIVQYLEIVREKHFPRYQEATGRSATEDFQAFLRWWEAGCPGGKA